MSSPEEELLLTEKNYVDSLTFVVNSYLLPMKSWFKILTQSFQEQGKDDTILCSYLMAQSVDIIDGLFKNLEQILQFHVYLLQELQETDGNRLEIVKKISKFDRGLLFYNDYIRNAETSRNLLNELKNDIRSPPLPPPLRSFLPSPHCLPLLSFRSFLSAIELNPASCGLSLEFQLAKPWQRVMKYTLLLEAMLKKTTVQSERELVQKTIHQLEGTLTDLNQKQEHADMVRIGKEREKYYGLEMFGPARRYVFDSKLKVITSNSKIAQSAILCTDVIFLGKKKGMFSAAAFLSYDLRQILVVRHPPHQSKFILLRLTSDTGHPPPPALLLSLAHGMQSSRSSLNPLSSVTFG
jgi:hypothetical protein